MRKVRNIRELQKKEKIRGLTRSAWGFSMLAPSWLIVFNPLYCLGTFLFLVFFFYIVEFFDDDFIEMSLIKINGKAKGRYKGKYHA